MKIVINSSIRLYRYLGQCDRLRCDQEGEDNWQNMMRNSQKVSCEELEANCDIQSLLEDDETLYDLMRGDPTSYCAKSNWGDHPCYYLMVSGFEFIFVADHIRVHEYIRVHE